MLGRSTISFLVLAAVSLTACTRPDEDAQPSSGSAAPTAAGHVRAGTGAHRGGDHHDHAAADHQQHEHHDVHHHDHTTTTTTTTSTSTTTTTTTLPLDVYDPACVVMVQAGDTLSLIADRFDDETVTGPAIQAENLLPDDVIDRRPTARRVRRQRVERHHRRDHRTQRVSCSALDVAGDSRPS